MKKEINVLIILIILIFLIIGFSYFRTNNTKKNDNIQGENNNPFQKYSFYQENNLNRYLNYQENYPNLSLKDVILRVNMNLDHSFYTQTKEVKEFNPLMIVNKYNYVSRDFTPSNLVKVDKFAINGMLLEENCKLAFIEMASKALEDNMNLRAVSTYRTYDYQNNLYNNYVKNDGVEEADTYSARPGFSEHHTGLALDIDNIKTSYTNFLKTEEFIWMMNNAYKYGFILRYPEDKVEITGYMYEPWHYRFVGVEIATYMKEHNLTYEEYYYEFLDK